MLRDECQLCDVMKSSPEQRFHTHGLAMVSEGTPNQHIFICENWSLFIDSGRGSGLCTRHCRKIKAYPGALLGSRNGRNNEGFRIRATRTSLPKLTGCCVREGEIGGVLCPCGRRSNASETMCWAGTLRDSTGIGEKPSIDQCPTPTRPLQI
jgi:hypothetical protein